MKKKLFIFVQLLFPLFIFAQKIEVSGQIKEKSSKKPLIFCHILANNENDSLIAATISDDKGFFRLEIPAGDYKLIFDYVSFEKDTLNIECYDDVFLGTIYLKAKKNSLGEVTVKASASQIEIDKQSVIVTKQMRINVNTTKDLLDKINGLTYDQLSDMISVDGNSNVIFLVNGMEKNQSYIQNLGPDKIRKIEIMRNPGGRYGLQGYSAIINLILKKNYQGVDFSNSLQVIVPTENDGKGLWTINKVIRNNLNFSFTQQKYNLYVDYNTDFSNFAYKTKRLQEFSDYNIKQEYIPEKNNEIIHFSNDITVGLDYYLNYKTTLSIESDFSFLPQKYNGINQNYLFSTLKNNNLLSKEEVNNITQNGNKGTYNSIFLKHIFNKNTTLNADFHYYDYTEQNSILIESLSDNEKQNILNHKKASIFYVEMNHNFAKNININAGYENKNKILNNQFQSSSNSTNSDFYYTDIRNSLYSYFKWSINTKLSLKLGAAIETSWQKTENQEHKYIIYRPFLNFMYSPINVLNITLKYRTWTDYPSIEQTNPFQTIVTNNTFSNGNPYLKPGTTHQISLRFDILQALVSIEPYYYFSNNLISETIYLDNQNQFITSFDNVGKYQKEGINVNFRIPIGHSIILQNYFNWYYNKIETNENINDFNFWTAQSNLVYINRQKGIIAGILYKKNKKKQITTFGYTFYKDDFSGIALQKLFFKNRAKATIIYILPVSLGLSYETKNYYQTPLLKQSESTDLSLIKNAFLFKIDFNFSKGRVKSYDKKDYKEKESTGKSIF